MKKSNLFLLALSIVLVLAASLNSALAYFTTYAEAKGGYIVTIYPPNTDINEDFSGWTKRVTITNFPDSQPVYVRARAYAGSQYTLLYSGEGWSLGSDGFYHYEFILNPGEDTAELQIKIDDVPDAPDDKEAHFNVEVIYEVTPVQYDADGNPYVDWDITGGVTE